jgi:hypothetical protein
MILETAISLATRHLGWQLTIAIVTFLDQYFVDVAFWCILIYIYNYIYIHMYILILLYCIHAKHMLLAHLEYVWMRFCAKTTQCGEGPDEWEEVDAGATLNAMSS